MTVYYDPYDIEITANPYRANLARLEGRVALDELLNRFPE
jgi:hypothetical protein